MSDILQAARSYYGLADTDVRKTDIYTNEAGQTMLVFEIAFTNDEFFGIADRMKAMNQAEAQEQPDTAIIEGPTVEAMREAYNALSKAEKAKYGSFGRYVTATSGGILEVPEGPDAFTEAEKQVIEYLSNLSEPARQVIHVDAPEEPQPVSMDAVWLWEDDATVPQKLHASDTRHHNRDGDYVMQYLVQWAMLTMEQRDHIHDSMLTDEQKQKAKEAKP